MSKATDKDASVRKLITLAGRGLQKLSLANAESKASGTGDLCDPITNNQ